MPISIIPDPDDIYPPPPHQMAGPVDQEPGPQTGDESEKLEDVHQGKIASPGPLPEGASTTQAVGDAVSLLWGDSSPNPNIPPPFTKAKCAVIVETAATRRLNSVLLHFRGVLGPEWPIFVFLADISSFSPTPAMTVRDNGTRFDPTDTSQVHPYNLRSLPQGFKIGSHEEYSRIMLAPWLWNQLAPFEKVFVFQLDSILCSNSQQRVEDFLEWDFIGAPIASRLGLGFDGGMSIRNRAMMLDIIRSHKDDPARKKSLWEDRYFYNIMKDMPEAKLPPPRHANKFSSKSIYGTEPLGYHQPKTWFREKLSEKREWCPEIDLVVGKRLQKG